MTKLVYKVLGQMGYLAALVFQEEIVAHKQREPLPDILLFVAHPQLTRSDAAAR